MAFLYKAYLVLLLSSVTLTYHLSPLLCSQKWNQEGRLFVNLEGESLSPRGLNKRFSGLLKRANLHLKGYGIHTMRHAHISELPTSNVPMFVLSRRAGHSSISATVDRYGHIISTLGDHMVELHLKSIRDVWKSAIV